MNNILPSNIECKTGRPRKRTKALVECPALPLSLTTAPVRDPRGVRFTNSLVTLAGNQTDPTTTPEMAVDGKPPITM